jgi:hypothetical protein
MARTNVTFTRTFSPFKLEPNIRLKLTIHNLLITKTKAPANRKRFMIPDKLRITFPNVIAVLKRMILIVLPLQNKTNENLLGLTDLVTDLTQT